jgi:hypothetical protein
MQMELEHVAEYDDERLLVLLGGLIVENALDRLLGEAIVKYKQIRDNRDFTFAMRITLAESLCLIPSKVLRAADLVRGLRNDFVHNLDVKSFEDLSRGPRTQGRVASMIERVKQFGVPIELDEGPPQVFNYLVTVTTIALRGYAIHVAQMARFIRAPVFHEQLARFVTPAGSAPPSTDTGD